MTYRAFVSSTFKDLKDHRAHVICALRRAGVSVDPMEDWTADSDEPKKFSQKRVEGCHLCILLVGFRRGHVPEGEKLSITQLEYQAAKNLGIYVLVFMLDEDAPWQYKFYELDKDPEICRWRAELVEHHGVEFFGLDPKTIDITGALVRWMTEKPADADAGRTSKRVEWPKDKSPYPGLFSFDDKYAPLFFGRDREVTEVIAKMSEPGGRFLILSGASGSGKSSLIGAGVWRALIQDNRIPGSRAWVWLRIQPGGDDRVTPFASLAGGFKHTFSTIMEHTDDLATKLAANQDQLRGLLGNHLDRDQELLLFVDQMEELFTQGFEEKDVGQFLETLVTIAQEKTNRLRVLATIRSESLSRLEEVPVILDLLNAGCIYHLGRVLPRALQDMIEKPAQATGYEFEPHLVDDMLRDAAQEPGHLPLVAYALKELYRRRQGQQLTREAYNDIHGVAGAIGTKADSIIDGLDPEAQGAFGRVFSKLMHVERDAPPTRRRVSQNEFATDGAAKRLVNALAAPDCRILVTDEIRQVEVAHEKIFTVWARLKAWIEREGDTLRLIEHATEESQRWRNRGEKLEDLWSAERVAEASAALNRFGKTPNETLSRFLHPQRILIKQLEQGMLSHQQRALIGEKLGKLGDPRPGVGLREDGLPDIRWSDPITPQEVEIEDRDPDPLIAYSMRHSGPPYDVVEYDPARFMSEFDFYQFAKEVQTPCSSTIPMTAARPFCIAIYLVTNAQFEAFLNAPDGYQKREWWKDLKSMDPKPPTCRDANQPRDTVCWFEAVAFCRWLTQKYRDTGLLKKESAIRLPTEWEWQQVATGGDAKNVYPWGPDWDAARCNSAESLLSRTTAVGIYPQGVSPWGALDMSGNVWQWCLNKYENPADPRAIRIDKSKDPRGMRGGPWFFGPNFRSAVRYGCVPDVGFTAAGFRLARDVN